MRLWSESKCDAIFAAEAGQQVAVGEPGIHGGEEILIQEILEKAGVCNANLRSELPAGDG